VIVSTKTNKSVEEHYPANGRYFGGVKKFFSSFLQKGIKNACLFQKNTVILYGSQM
jgi:hypothetical protein